MKHNIVNIENEIKHGVLIQVITYKRPVFMSNESFYRRVKIHAMRLGSNKPDVRWASADCKYIESRFYYAIK